MADEDLARLRIEKSPVVPGRLRQRKRRAWFLVFLFSLLTIGLYAAGLFSTAIEVEVATVSLVYPSQPLTLLNASGYVVAQRKAAVGSKTTGRLEWLGVEEGSRVRGGEVIARLENRDALAAREEAAAELARARTGVAGTEAELHEATLSFRRMKELLAERAVARAEYELAEARYLTGSAAVAAARASVKSAEAALRGAEVALGYTFLRAPFDGVVLIKNADLGDIVTPIGAAAEAKAAVVNIADLDSLQVEADVSESNLAKVRLGQACEIQLDALPERRFAGAVHMIVPTADRAKATVMVKVRFLEKDPGILPEMSARVSFLERPLAEEEREARTAVGSAAVVVRDGRRVVFRLEGERAVASPVTTGVALGEMLEITGGAQAGDRVVIRPLERIKDGRRVRLAGD